MGDCPKCGFANPGAVDFCPNPQCRTYLGWASAASAAPPPRPSTPQPPITVPPPRPSPGPPTAPMPPAPGPTAGPPQKRGVRVTVDPAELIVDPGGEVTTTVTVRNLGTRVEEFRLTPGGPAAAFTSIEPNTLSIYPEDEQRAVARFAPVRGSQSPAGVAPFEIVALSAIHSDVSDVARGQVTVTPFTELRAVLRPEVSRGRRPTRHRVSVTNGGNTPVSAQLTFRDQDGELTFQPPGGATTLPAGGALDYSVRINGPHRWFGRTERHPFSAVLTPAPPQPPITLNGTRRQTAVFPWWIPIAAAILVALVLPLFFLLKPDPPTVPVIGPVDEATAVQELTDAKYKPVVTKIGDDNVAEGVAIRTDPPGSTPHKHGEQVKLYISTGKCAGLCPVEVPNVEGLTESEARAALQNKKFRVTRVNRITNDLPVGQVIGSQPRAPELRPVGSEVVLTVSLGPKGGPGGSGSTTSPAQIKVPDLTTLAAGDATKKLKELGLKAKTVPVHSNAVANGEVVSTKPVAESKVNPASEVTLTVARNTARVDLIATAGQATWKKNESVTLTFPGTDGDFRGFVLIRNPGMLEDGTTAKVLETRPEQIPNGSITGIYKLAEPVIAGDHVRARVGLLQGAGGEVTFVVKAKNQIIEQVTETADGTLTEFDADLSPAKGATSIEIIVLGGASTPGDLAVWQNLRLEPTVG